MGCFCWDLYRSAIFIFDEKKSHILCLIPKWKACIFKNFNCKRRVSRASGNFTQIEAFRLPTYNETSLHKWLIMYFFLRSFICSTIEGMLVGVPMAHIDSVLGIRVGVPMAHIDPVLGIPVDMPMAHIDPVLGISVDMPMAHIDPVLGIPVDMPIAHWPCFRNTSRHADGTYWPCFRNTSRHTDGTYGPCFRNTSSHADGTHCVFNFY